MGRVCVCHVISIPLNQSKTREHISIATSRSSFHSTIHSSLNLTKNLPSLPPARVQCKIFVRSFLPPTNTHLLMQIPNNPPSFADGRREKKKKKKEESSLMAKEKEKEKGSAIMAPMKIFNGERVVVLLTIIRLFFSMELPLVWEGVALFLLAVAALFVEFIVDPCGIPCFKTRAGASSGILLGSTTLPMVMLSRLIQFSRAPSDRVGIAEIKYLNMQYWCASVGSFIVLVFLSFILSNIKDKKKLVHMERLHLIPMSVFYLLLFLIPCCLSLAEKSDTGYLVGTKAAWILSHGFASALLVQYVLHAFPSCASIGEAILTTGGLFLYFSDGLLYTLSKVDFRSLMNLSFTHYGARRSLISTIMQGVLVGLLLSCLMFKYVIQAWDFLATQFNREGRVNDTRNDLSVDSRRSILFYVSIGVTLFISAPLWMHAVQDFREHPYTWIFTFILQEPLKRILLCAYWVALISPAVSWFYNISKNSKVERILLRKFYHLLAVAMFVPAVLFQSEFLDLAFAGALAVFLVLEMIRVWRVWPFGNLIHQFMNAFTDHRDSELLIISHFSLLLGCALPKWLSSGFNDRPLAPFAGILSLGIGDTMASIIGYKYGVLRWSKTGKKTVEGTAAGITFVMVACTFLLAALASTGHILSQHWLSLVIAVTLSGMLEAYTAQLDNAFIPLVFFSLLCM